VPRYLGKRAHHGDDRQEKKGGFLAKREKEVKRFEGGRSTQGGRKVLANMTCKRGEKKDQNGLPGRGMKREKNDK